MILVIHQTIGMPPAAVVGGPPNPDVMALKEKSLAALGKLPPFSPILSKLKVLLSEQDVSFAVLGDLIEKDAVLAGRFLGAVNSAAYTRVSTISSVRHALSVLGTEKVRNAVLGMSASCLLNQAPTPPGWSMERFNKHSAAVAILSDLIAQRTAVDFPEGAFVAGLLHDIGRLLIAIGLPLEFHRIRKDYQTSSRTWIECEQFILGFGHAELSGEALAVWKIPDPIVQAVAEHHTPVQPQSGKPLSLGWVLNAANQYVNSLGESIMPVAKPDNAGSVWMESLGMDRATLAQLFTEFRAEHDSIAQYFQ